MYKLRDGIVLICVQGVYILVADKQAREYCPYMKRINETGAFIWDLLEKNISPDEMLRCFMETYEIDDVAPVREDIAKYLDYLKENGYMII